MSDFPQSVKTLALIRAGLQCECVRRHPHHFVRCANRTGLEFHHKTAEVLGGGNSLSNCEVLCVPCHRLTPSYGRH